MPNQQENSCDCDACRENNIKKLSPKDMAFVEAFLLRNALKKEVTEEDKELAKGKAVIVGMKLGQDIWADQHACRFIRLNEVERLLFSGQARKATRRELQDLAA